MARMRPCHQATAWPRSRSPGSAISSWTRATWTRRSAPSGAGWRSLREFPHGHCSLLNALDEYLQALEPTNLRGDAREAGVWAATLGAAYRGGRVCDSVRCRRPAGRACVEGSADVTLGRYSPTRAAAPPATARWTPWRPWRNDSPSRPATGRTPWNSLGSFHGQQVGTDHRVCVVRTGPFIDVSGTTASGPDGNIVGIDDPYAQTRQILANISKALAAVGAGPEHVVRTRIDLSTTSVAGRTWAGPTARCSARSGRPPRWSRSRS